MEMPIAPVNGNSPTFLRFRLKTFFVLTTLIAILLALHIWNQNSLNRALRQHVDMKFSSTDLDELLNYVTEKFGLEIVISKSALPESSKNSLSFTCNFEDVELGSGLRIILNQHGLDYMIEDNILVILTDTELSTYSVSAANKICINESQMTSIIEEKSPFSDESIDNDTSGD